MKNILLFLVFLLPSQIFPQQTDSLMIRLQRGATIRESLDFGAKILKELREPKYVKLVEINYYDAKYLKVIIDNKIGYVSEMYVEWDNKSQMIKDSLLAIIKKEQIEKRERDIIITKQKLVEKERKEKEFKIQRKNELESLMKQINLRKNPVVVKPFFKIFFSVKGKGEFESTVEFSKRDKYLDSSMQYFDYYIDEKDVFFSYDADREKFDFFINRDEIPLLSIYKSLGTHIGENAFKVKRTIYKYERTNYVLRTLKSQVDLRNISGYLASGDNAIKVPRGKARETKNHLSIRVGVIFYRYNDKDLDIQTITPTIDSPYDGTIITYAIKSEVKCIIFYNNKTKEIYDIFF